MIRYTKGDFKTAIDNTQSMSAAAKELGISYDTFRRYAQKYGLFNPNQSGKDRRKPRKFKTREDVFKVFEYNVGRFVVKNWYLLENEYKCEKCDISSWLGGDLVLELHHINGNRKDNRLENLTLLCPNCHSQTDNWRK